MLQKAYLRIWRRAGQYDPTRCAPSAWLGVIARNAALDAVSARRPTEELEATDIPDVAVVQIDPPDARLGQCLNPQT